MNCSPKGWFQCHTWFLFSIISAEVVMVSSLHRASSWGVHRKMNKKKAFGFVCAGETQGVGYTEGSMLPI